MNKEDLILDKVNQVHAEVKKLNGSVAANTKFRIRGNVYFKLTGIFLTLIAIPVVLIIIEWQFNK